MNELRRRIAALPAEKRALLALRNPLSFAQRRFWFMAQMEPEGGAWNVPSGLRFSGPLDIPSLRRSLDAVAERHAVLRSLFPSFDGQPLQLAGPPAPIPLPEVDLGALPAAAREAEALAIGREEAALPFDLAEGPLLRALLLRLGAEDHVFLLDLHHIVCDGWSQDILRAEMAGLYAAFAAGAAPRLPALPIQYADFARWQVAWLESEAAHRQLDHWRQRLDGMPQVLALPADRRRPPDGRHRGAEGGLDFPLPLAEAFERLARAEGASLFMAGLAAFLAVLHRHTGQSDLVVGTPMATRPRTETEGLVGLFQNLLVLRAGLAGDPTFRQLLAQVRERTLEAYENGDLPFDLLVDELQAEREPGVHPLFQVMFTQVSRPVVRGEHGGVRMATFDVETTTGKYDLSISLLAWEGGLSVQAGWNAELFDAPTVPRLLGHYQTLAAVAAADPDRALSALPLMTRAERWQALGEWNDTGTAYAGGFVHQLVEAQVDRDPGAVAAVCEGAVLPYGELDRRANRLARHLGKLGVGPDGRVGIFLERSLDAVVAVLAVVKAGAAYLPLDPDHPAERLAFQMEDAGLHAVVTRSDLLRPRTGAAEVLLDLQAEEIAACSEARPGVTVTGEMGFYLLYTSGSTGRPKGALNTHAALRNRLLWKQEAYGLTPEDRVLQKTPFGFDVSAWELFWPLMTGARIVVARPGGHLDPEYLADLIAREGVTTFHFVPPLLAFFLDQRDLDRCRSVRRLLVGGEALSPDLARRFHERFPGADLHHLYGPTEAAIDVTFHRCQPGRPGDPAAPPIGRPLANLRIVLLDRNLEPVPIGVPGEIRIGGLGLARGYVGRPDLTAEKFLPDPYAAEPGERLYSTGDLARFRLSGEIEFLGRIDHQVKIRGVRIEPGEIEAVLESHPAVGRAVVEARGQAGEKHLVAYLAPPARAAARKLRTFATSVGQGEMRRFLEAKLPPAMVPAQIVVLDALPLLPSGKVDRRALPVPEPATAIAAAVAAGGERTPTQDRVAALWEQILKVERIGLRDNFFDLGGHSILAVQAVARLRKAFGVEVPLRAVFESPTVAELSERIEEILRARAGIATPPLERTQGEGAAPLSFAQQRLWFLDQLEPGNAFYNMSASVRLTGALDVRALAAALAEIVRRHESLRTSFRSTDGEPVQVVVPEAGPEVGEIDLRSLPRSALEREAHRAANQAVQRPFDLSQGRLLRALVLRLAERDQAVVLTLHHIAGDGWSTGVLIHEASVLYRAFSRGEPSPLPELAIQYTDFARWQRSWLKGEALDKLLAYWRGRLEDALEPLELPADRPRPPVQSHRGSSRIFQLPDGLGRKLHALSRAQGGTLFATLLAGLQTLLHRYTGRRAVTVGFPVASRTHVELEPLIGFFVNTLVLRADLAPELPFRDLLAQVNEAALSAYVHQDLPFEKLVEELQPERSLAHSPLFQVMLALQNAPMPALELPGLAAHGFGTENAASRFDWTMFLLEAGDGLVGSLEYSLDLFDAATIVRAAGHFRVLLESAVADPARRLGELPLLAAAERWQLVHEWNGAEEMGGGKPLLVHESVERWAERMPGQVAIEAGDYRLTYRELVQESRGMAERLQSMGVGLDGRVAICLERSPELLVAILGVLRAGAAYLPLDPSHPRERLAFQMEDSRVSVLITRGELAGGLPVPAEVQILIFEREGGPRPPALSTDGNSLAYIIYTSGSTGRPKGVAMRHGAVANLMAWQIERSGLAPGARTLSFSQPTFDVSFQEIFSTWGAGGTLVLVPEEVRRDPPALLRALESERIERLFLPAVALEGLADSPRRTPAPAHLREVITAGERLRITPAVAAFFRGGARLFNQYGPSETHVVTEHPLEGPAEGWEPLPPIGRPVPRVSIQVVGPGLEPAPIGVAGELCIGGEAVARGYLERPGLTAERFVPDPFLEGSRLYRTGDLARRRIDGAVEFLGRIDEQVKVRGFRVEPGEVEVALSRCPGVHQAVVVARGAGASARLVAFVVAEGEAPSASELRTALENALPEPMVPSAFVFLDELPLTRTGKVDRRALPEAGPDRPGDEYAVPRTVAEELVAAIWSEVLGIAKVGARDSFFELGGHSLLATRVMSRVRDAFGVDLPLRRLFEHPTVEALAAAIESEGREVAEPPILRVPWEEKPELPLSFAQSRLWFLDRYEPGSAVYNLPLAVRLVGGLDEGALAASLAEIVRRHEALRTVFAVGEGGEPVQEILPSSRPAINRRATEKRPINGAFKPDSSGASPSPGIDARAEPIDAFFDVLLPIVDLTGLRDEKESRRLAAEEARRPFDLETGPLFRAVLLRLPFDHLVLVTQHHIVSDGWSQGVLIREVTELYAAFSQDHPSPLPDLPLQYADFAVWQRCQLSGDRLASLVEHWRERLAGAPAALELPADHPRPAVQTFRGARRTAYLPSIEPLRALGRKETATLFMSALASFGALLGRLAGQEDVVVGTPIANRGRVELEGLIGFFVNTLALRVDLRGDVTFRELLRRVRATSLDAYAHQDVPFERLVEELRPERDLARSPVFQAMLILQNAPAPAVELPGLQMISEGTEEAVAKFDVTLALEEAGEGLSASLNYNRDLFEESTAARWLAAFLRILEAAAADPETRLSDLPWLGPEERAQVTGEWARGAVVPPLQAARTAVELFECWARKRPDAEALVWDGGRWTYAELNRRAEEIAAGLREQGVGPEVKVGVRLERSPEAIVAMLGIWKAGGAYVPLDPAYPEERLRWMEKDAELRLVWPLTPGPSPRGRGENPGTRQERVPASVFPPSPPGRGAGGEGQDGSAAHFPPLDTLACVFYTSGSTGEPKGVAVPHRGVARLVAGDCARFGPDETILQFVPLSFDVATFEIWGALANGGRLALAPPGTPSLAELGAVIRRFEVTTLWLTAGLFHLMIDERLDDLRGLRQLLAGGDVLSPAHVLRARELAGAAMINGYGPTENATFTTVWQDAGERMGATVPIGRPIAGTRVYVVNRGLRPLPIGVAGELVTGGAGLARGYLGRPGLTAERFVPDPFEGPGERLYRTGDLARWLADGTLEFLGRGDRQVKVRGFRVELGEIEAALGGHPGVRESAVLLLGNDVEDRRLVAFVVPDPEQADAGPWRAFLEERLPAPLVPSVFVALDALPLTANGKLDRDALAKSAPRAGRAAETTPRTLTEEVLAAIWEEVLGLERVGMEDGFFDLGGHSLLATQVISRIRRAFGAELPLRDLFEAPTVRGLAARIERAKDEERGRTPPPLVPELRIGVLPLSFSQQRLWFLARWEPGSAAYNIPLALRVEGPLRAEVLESVFAEIVRRHESLRTVFEAVDGEPVQVVREAGEWTLPVVDLSGLPGADSEAVRLAHEEAGRPFDLARGLIFRATLLRLAPDDHAVLATVHHIAADGWSLGVLVREVGTLYAAFADGRPSPLPELPVQYADYAVWQRRWLSGEVLEAEVAHWRERLAGAPPVLDLPADRPRPTVRSSRGASRLASLPGDLAEGVRTLARREAATPFMVLLAVFQALLGRLAGMDDIYVGTPVAGRTRVETEDLIGFFVNTLVLRGDLSGNPSLRALVGRTRETALDAHAHQDVPFEKLVEALDPDRDPSRTPIFQVLFALQNAPRGGLGLPELRTSPLPLESTSAKFDLTLSLTESEGGFHGGLEYAADLFDATTVDRLLGHLQTFLAQALAEPDRPLADLPFLASLSPPLPVGGSAGGRGGRGVRGVFEPPRDALETEIAHLWEEILSTGPIGRSDRFFDLGGHSLLAVRLLARVHRRFGRDLPLSALFTAPTVEHLAVLLRRSDPPEDGPLVALQPKGEGAPFFCIHPIGGNVLCYAGLARALGDEQPFYGLQSTVPVPGSIPEMAERYLEEILRAQPEGPYRIGGWSMGALIAFEIARRLRGCGKEVALLALLDPTSPRDLARPEPDEAALLDAFAHDLAALGQPEPEDLSGLRPLFEVYRANAAAMRRYRPEPYEGRADLFQSREGDVGKDWQPFVTGGLDIHRLSGGHYGLLEEPHVRVLAEHLRRRYGHPSS